MTGDTIDPKPLEKPPAADPALDAPPEEKPALQLDDGPLATIPLVQGNYDLAE
jgi:hypothetical protein